MERYKSVFKEESNNKSWEGLIAVLSPMEDSNKFKLDVTTVFTMSVEKVMVKMAHKKGIIFGNNNFELYFYEEAFEFFVANRSGIRIVFKNGTDIQVVL